MRAGAGGANLLAVTDHTPTLESRVRFLRNGAPSPFWAGAAPPHTNCLLRPQYPPQCIYSQARSSGGEAVSPRPMKHPREWRCAKDKLTPRVILAEKPQQLVHRTSETATASSWYTCAWLRDTSNGEGAERQARSPFPAPRGPLHGVCLATV